MPWQVRARGDEWCVYKEGEDRPVPGGCHAARSQALAHQRALYANEAQTASVPARIEVLSVPASDDSVMPALIAAVDVISERLLANEQALLNVATALEAVTRMVDDDREDWRQAMTAAARASAPEPPVVNVTVPETQVEVRVPEQPAPIVNVQLPRAVRHVTLERDLSGKIERARIEEE